MYYKGLTWKFKLLLVLVCLWTGPLVLFSYYKENGYLPKSAIIGAIIVSIFGFLLILLGDRSWRKYNMSQEITPDKNDEK